MISWGSVGVMFRGGALGELADTVTYYLEYDT